MFVENTPDGLASETNYLSEHKNSFVDKKAICQIFEMISGTVHVQFQVERERQFPKHETKRLLFH